MIFLWTIVAVLTPWLLGMAVCRGCRCAFWKAVAFGWFVGQALVMIGGYFLVAYCGISGFKWVAASALVAGLAALIFNERRRRALASPAAPGASRDAPYERPTMWTWFERIMVLVLLLSLGTKCMAGGIAIAWIPSRCEDALAYWLFKAKVITLLGHMPLDRADPFYLGGSNPKYPIYPSMIAAWIPMVVGEWRESLAVIPWLLTFLNLPLAVATSLPRATPRLIRIAIAYAVSSIPLAAIHVYRPGYVDLILASFLMCGLGMMLSWRTSSRASNLWLAMLLFDAAACTKREGIVAAAVVLGVFTLDTTVRRYGQASKTRVMLPIAIATGGVVTYLLMDMSDVASDAAHWAYHPEAWAALWRHAVTWSSFSMLFPFAMIASGGLIIYKRSPEGRLAIGLCLTLLAYAASPFLLTDNIRFAVNDQTPSRLLLQVAPAIVVALANGFFRGLPCPELTN